jgi:hypothetical protein
LNVNFCHFCSVCLLDTHFYFFLILIRFELLEFITKIISFSVGCFTAAGVPFMAMAMAKFASLLLTVGDPDECKHVITSKVTRLELDMLSRLKIVDTNVNRTIDRNGFALLCAVRLGALSADLIETINKRFDELDVYKDGVLHYEEILEIVRKPERKLSIAPLSMLHVASAPEIQNPRRPHNERQSQSQNSDQSYSSLAATTSAIHDIELTHLGYGVV